MTTYTTIANTEIDADSPVTTTLMQAYRDNIAATAEGSANAPIVAAAWHPVDAVLVATATMASYGTKAQMATWLAYQ